MKQHALYTGFVVSVSLLVSQSVKADWSDLLGDWLGGNKQEQSQPQATSPAKQALSQADMNAAILEALQVGVKRAIELLGKKNGFLGDDSVRIPMPDHLLQVESLLRKFGQDKYADRFITSMNRAAEQAVPQTTQVFIDAIKGMSVSDAKGLLKGPDDAATRYFEEKTSPRLREIIRPIVSRSMDDVGVTKTYKKFIGKADFLDGYVDRESLDLDKFVTDKALDGLFLKLAEEEKKIRKDPVARSTELLKKVFSKFSL